MEAETIEHFYGVYLLYCTNPKYLGRTYIGYTVDPNRRIKQHNLGKKFGGAWKTSNRGPWSMVLIVHGFPNDISALQFEWAWQHPNDSRRLRGIPKKKPKEKNFDYQIRVLGEMLNVGPWKRLPLTIRWLNEDFKRDFPDGKIVPMHMPICYGSIISKKILTDDNLENPKKSQNCSICNQIIVGKLMKCVNYECDLIGHVVCLSKFYLKLGQYVPVEGECPKCKKNFLWGDLVRKYRGCYNNLDLTIKNADNLLCESDT